MLNDIYGLGGSFGDIHGNIMQKDTDYDNTDNVLVQCASEYS
jgi:hypothetical protein